MENKLPKGTLGGQAVIEGVMMKGKDGYSVAIRKPDQKIEVKLQKYKSFGDKHVWARVPFIRGVVNFTESMVIGMKTLSYSSSFYEEEEEETKADKLIKEVFKEKAEGVIMGLTVFLSVILAIALFMMLPAAIGEFIGKWVDSRLLLSLIEGIIRLVIFIIYVVLISQMEDIRRVFMYHGAEHKTINCYESGDELTPENVAKHTRYHKRCGTSFLFIVMVVSIIIFMFITADQMWLRFLLRLLLIPVVAGISYEFIKLAGKTDNAVMNVLSKPGMWIQRLTTKEPDEEMIQVAIISVEAVLYGKPYVNAVNEAQGLGKAAKQEAAEPVDDMEDIEMQEEVFEEEYEEVIEEIIYQEEISEDIQEEIEEAIEMISENTSEDTVDVATNVDSLVEDEEVVQVVKDEEVVRVLEDEEVIQVVEDFTEVTKSVSETVNEEDKTVVENSEKGAQEVVEHTVEKEQSTEDTGKVMTEAEETAVEETTVEETVANKKIQNERPKEKNAKKKRSKKGKK